ncbi:MAG: hypothetical protein ACE5GE_05420 [Phycisphaerae bacterium]
MIRRRFQHSAKRRAARPGQRHGRPIASAGALALLVALAGCRAHPISLAISLAGDVVDREDVSAREPLLVGKPATAADEMFGPRHDTLYDRRSPGRWQVYAESGEPMAESFYVVEVGPDESIENLFKVKRNIDGLEDLRSISQLSSRVIGADLAECEQEAGLGERQFVMYSQATGYDAYFYDARDLTHTRGERYWIFCFDPHGRCWEVRRVGVTAD